MLDIVLYGATGFTGALTGQYLKQHAGDLRWGIAGRSEAKLHALAERLQLDVPVLVADSDDRAALDTMVAQTRVVATTVGPYARYGTKLVEAAVAAGVHTCDLTGEPTFVRRNIDAHHEAARASGARIVHCCGFDSIPSDLGTLLLQQAAVERFGSPCEEVEMVVLGARGGFSGGTVASMMTLMEEAADPTVRSWLLDPYSLAPGVAGPDTGEQRGARYSAKARAWTAPFLMAGINERVVRRSNHLAGAPPFRYHESMRMGSGLRGRLSASALSAALGVGALALTRRRVRQLAQRYLPAPGDGPDQNRREEGFFKLRLFGTRAGGVDGQDVTVTVTGSLDPGYGSTAVLLAESALCLATTEGSGGVLTPAVALGDALLQRLSASPVQFRVEP